MSEPLSLERLSTGSEHFDAVLGGGVPTGAVIVIAGTPGTGKALLFVPDDVRARACRKALALRRDTPEPSSSS